MKLTITKLKAPWPNGAKVGDVVEFADVPSWAVGKCSIADDDAEVTLLAEAVGDGSGEALPDIEAINLQVADLTAKLDVLSGQHRDALDALSAADGRAQAAEAQVADLTAKLAAVKATKK